jgi:hypothetical protein
MQAAQDRQGEDLATCVIWWHWPSYRLWNTHHLNESSLLPILSVRVLKTATLPLARKDPVFKRSSRGRVLASSVVEVRAVSPSPWDAERSSPEATTLWPCARFSSMLLFHYGFRLQVSRCSWNISQILADCVGVLIVRDTAHVASTRVCELLLRRGSGKQEVESSAGMVGKEATRSSDVRRP